MRSTLHCFYLHGIFKAKMPRNLTKASCKLEYLHGRYLGGLGVQMLRPLEEDKTKAGWDPGVPRLKLPQAPVLGPRAWEVAEASAQPTAFNLGGACGIWMMQRGTGTPGAASPGQAGALLAFPEKSPCRPGAGDACKIVRQSSGCHCNRQPGWAEGTRVPVSRGHSRQRADRPSERAPESLWRRHSSQLSWNLPMGF